MARGTRAATATKDGAVAAEVTARAGAMDRATTTRATEEGECCRAVVVLGV